MLFQQPAISAASELIEFRESNYNSIFVHKRDSYVAMSFGHNKRFYTESVFNSEDELELPVTYTRFMTAALAYVDKPGQILEIGFGGGRTAWYLHKSIKGLKITSVELDPVVYELAIKHFGIAKEDGFVVEVADGRRYMHSNDQLRDIIMIDAYRGPFVPFHLMTNEFYKLVKARLSPGGVVVQNVEPTTMVFDSALKTIGEVFDNIDLYDAGGNIVMIAYDGAAKTGEVLNDKGKLLDSRYGVKYPFSELLSHRQIVKNLPEVDPLTDDFAPVESLLAIERHNRKLDEYTK